MYQGITHYGSQTARCGGTVAGIGLVATRVLGCRWHIAQAGGTIVGQQLTMSRLHVRRPEALSLFNLLPGTDDAQNVTFLKDVF
jgi:hypothetical protein